jgi:hypothetical protein
VIIPSSRCVSDGQWESRLRNIGVDVPLSYRVNLRSLVQRAAREGMDLSVTSRASNVRRISPLLFELRITFW